MIRSKDGAKRRPWKPKNKNVLRIPARPGLLADLMSDDPERQKSAKEWTERKMAEAKEGLPEGVKISVRWVITDAKEEEETMKALGKKLGIEIKERKEEGIKN